MVVGMRAAQILIKSSQKTETGRSEMEIEVEGSISTKNSVCYLIYKEPEGTGLVNTTTTLKIDDQKVTLIRSGSTSLKQVFQKGEETYSTYKTPYGNFPLTVAAKEVKVELIKDKGKIFLQYDISVGGERMEDQSLTLHFYSI